MDTPVYLIRWTENITTTYIEWNSSYRNCTINSFEGNVVWYSQFIGIPGKLEVAVIRGSGRETITTSLSGKNVVISATVTGGTSSTWYYAYNAAYEAVGNLAPNVYHYLILGA